ncbi:5-oxoprolinase subunit PxpA [Microbacterium sp.]|uniref:5-oxoprolinase subunit PxpA n=1 Tax=Microbacterium sp. TaxID=51671 RepID=UPI0025EFEE3D|nr:5-oxoprolinase subunit PxpA [Microbacterium sp.]
MTAIDLNADLGETVDGAPTADDAAMFAVISSASIACGGHAGDAASMRDAVALAHRHGVAVGAHPSYPDRAGFGRNRLRMPREELRESVSAQLRALWDAGADIRYVKPHGALYHAIRDDRAEAWAVAAAVSDLSQVLGRAVPILGMDGEIDRAAAAAGLPFRREAFLDRAYLPDGSLVPRGNPAALLTEPDRVAARALRVVMEATLDAQDGTALRTAAVSLCLHGDSSGAVEMARAVRAALDAAEATVRAPW